PLPLRKLAVESLAQGWNSETHLVGMLKEDRLPEPLKIAAANKLLGVWRVAYRNVAAEILHLEQNDTFTSISDLVEREGNPDLGPAIYQQHCMSCHQLNGEGIDFGPALTEIGSKLSTEALFAAIIQPSAGVSFGYEGYFIETRDGQKLTGYIASETASSLTIRQQGGNSTEIVKDDIIRKEPLEASLMTSGLHQAMGEEALVNLVAYLRTLQRTGPAVAAR
ncbi:MAG: c-type cytochrome, partial [Bacteroidota bacterium]